MGKRRERTRLVGLQTSQGRNVSCLITTSSAFLYSNISTNSNANVLSRMQAANDYLTRMFQMGIGGFSFSFSLAQMSNPSAMSLLHVTLGCYIAIPRTDVILLPSLSISVDNITIVYQRRVTSTVHRQTIPTVNAPKGI